MQNQVNCILNQMEFSLNELNELLKGLTVSSPEDESKEHDLTVDMFLVNWVRKVMILCRMV